MNEPTTPPADDLDVNLASPGSRIGATMINCFFMAAIMFAGMFLFGFAIMDSPIDPAQLNKMSEAERIAWAQQFYSNPKTHLVWLLPLGFALVQLVLTACTGASVGKLMLGLRVVHKDGRKAGFLYGVLLRKLVYWLVLLTVGSFLSGTLLFLWLLLVITGIVMLFTDPLRRTPVDFMAQTLVIQLPRR